MSEDDRVFAQLRQSIEGQLLKFTNVMKGYQPRWVVLDAEKNVIEYYEKEEFRRNGQKARGALHLFGAAIYPSDEDSQTFTIQSAGAGSESFRLKAVDAKERQRWIMHLRAVSEHAQPFSFVPISSEMLDSSSSLPRASESTAHQQSQSANWYSTANNNSNINITQQTSVSMNGSSSTNNSQHNQNVVHSQSEAEPVNVLELSGSDVHRQLVELIERMQQECELTSAHISALPAPGAGISPAASDAPVGASADNDTQQAADSSVRSLDCLDRDLLMMKATIRAAVASVMECHVLLDPRKAATNHRTTIAHQQSRTRGAHSVSAAAAAANRIQSARTNVVTNKARSVSAAMAENGVDIAVEAICAEQDPSRSTSSITATLPIGQRDSLSFVDADSKRGRLDRSDSFASAMSNMSIAPVDASANGDAFTDLITDHFSVKRPSATG